MSACAPHTTGHPTHISLCSSIKRILTLCSSRLPSCEPTKKNRSPLLQTPIIPPPPPSFHSSHVSINNSNWLRILCTQHSRSFSSDGRLCTCDGKRMMSSYCFAWNNQKECQLFRKLTFFLCFFSFLSFFFRSSILAPFFHLTHYLTLYYSIQGQYTILFFDTLCI